jgi:hypothetical protein
MKYPKTWQAIEEALKQSEGWNETDHLNNADEPVTVYQFIESAVRYMRQYPTDKEIMDWNLVCCAGSEMKHDPAAPVWNRVIDIWIAEEKEKEVALEAQRKSPARLARVS